MDYFEYTKIVGAVLFTLLVLTGVRVGVNGFYHPQETTPPVYLVAPAVAENPKAKPGSNKGATVATKPATGTSTTAATTAPKGVSKAAPTGTSKKGAATAVAKVSPKTDAKKGAAKGVTTAAIGAATAAAGHALFAGANPAKGKTIAGAICVACHDISSAKKIRFGPPLWGVFGRKKASYPGFSYSSAFKKLKGNWTLADLDRFLTKPSAFAPGTRMSFVGFKDEKRRHNVISWLATLGSSGASTLKGGATPTGPGNKAGKAPTKKPPKKGTKAPDTTAAAAKGMTTVASSADKGEAKGKTTPTAKGASKIAPTAKVSPKTDAKKGAPRAAAPAAPKGVSKAAPTPTGTSKKGAATAVAKVSPKSGLKKGTAKGVTKTAASGAATAAAGHALFAGANPAKGKTIAGAICVACHDISSAKKIRFGPPLWGVFGRKKASYPGFSYSSAFKKLKGNWTPADLDRFLTKPSAFAPGTRMSFVGFKDEKRRHNVISWLATLGSSGASTLKKSATPTGPGNKAGKATTKAPPKKGTKAPDTTAAAAKGMTKMAVSDADKGEAKGKTTPTVKGVSKAAPTAEVSPTAKGVSKAAPTAKVSPKAEAKKGTAKGGTKTAAIGAALTKRQCGLCHTVTKNGKSRMGPPLWGVFGRKKASYPGFSYSKALTRLGGVWNKDDLDRFLTSPARYAKGTRMAFVGIKDPKKRRAIIDWLAAQK